MALDADGDRDVTQESLLRFFLWKTLRIHAENVRPRKSDLKAVTVRLRSRNSDDANPTQGTVRAQAPTSPASRMEKSPMTDATRVGGKLAQQKLDQRTTGPAKNRPSEKSNCKGPTQNLNPAFARRSGIIFGSTL